MAEVGEVGAEVGCAGELGEVGGGEEEEGEGGIEEAGEEGEECV